MQGLTPLDIQKQTFARGLKGYNVDEVRGYLHLIAEEIERLVRDADRLSRENAMLRGELDEHNARERILKDTLLSAQKVSEDVRANAHKEAELIVKDAVKLFDVIQAVDSLDLAEKLARAADNQGRRLEIMLQVNIGDEPQKSGIARSDVESIAKQAAALASLNVIGLMALPPIGTPEESRPYFRELRSMRDALGLRHLSMGMSEDFETAIEEGSTIVRVGRAIFGSRPARPAA